MKLDMNVISENRMIVKVSQISLHILLPLVIVAMCVSMAPHRTRDVIRTSLQTFDTRSALARNFFMYQYYIPVVTVIMFIGV